MQAKRRAEAPLPEGKGTSGLRQIVWGPGCSLRRVSGCFPARPDLWHVGGMHRDHGHVCSLEMPLFHNERRQGQDVAVRLHVRQRAQQRVRHAQAGRAAVIFGADKKDAGFVMPRQVIGKSTDGLPGILGTSSLKVSLRSRRSDFRASRKPFSSASVYRFSIGPLASRPQ